MNVFITGGGGFLGQRLARTLLERQSLAGSSIGRIVLFDQAFPANVDARLSCIAGDIAADGVIASALPKDCGAVFHLAAVVSGGAEADFDLGYRVNLDGTRALLQACRGLTAAGRLVHTSSVAAFGGAMPAVLDDSTIPNPQSSYGAQKVMGEYLVADYSRKGFVDGRSVRLPTIVVRPGKPNAAASSFASGIIREPLNGEAAVCPVADSTGVWLLSPSRAIDALIHAMETPATDWGTNRTLNLPGITATVREMLDALAIEGGADLASRVRFVADERIQRIVQTWPTRFRTERADAMGFKADIDVGSVIRAHMTDQGIKR